MTTAAAIVFVIDDDQSVRKSLRRLLDAANYKTELFNSASDFLQRSLHPGPSCIIIDVRMPGLTGMDLQKTLIESGREEQLIFITAHGDIPMCAQAMKAGASRLSAKTFQTQATVGERRTRPKSFSRTAAPRIREGSRARATRAVNAARVPSDATRSHGTAQ